MNLARLLLPLAGAIAACLVASGCKRAPLTCGRGGCDAGALGGSVGGGGGAGGGAGRDARGDGSPDVIGPAADAADAADDGGDAAGSDARDGAGPDGGTGSASCAANPTAPSYAFIGIPIDFDEDGVADQSDDCPASKNPTQVDVDGDGLGDACDKCPSGTDGDRDGVCDAADNCPAAWNPSQTDVDGDGSGDACDTQACNTAPGVPETQRYLALLLRHSEVAALVAGRRWRLASAQSFCTNGNKHGVAFTIYDYDGRQSLFPNLNVDDDTLITLRMSPFDSSGPQASAAEGYEAIALARADKTVQQHIAATGASDASIFFFEFPRDARFAACDTGRCVDVLFAAPIAGGSQIIFTAVVDLQTCRVLGFVDRSP